MDRMKIERTESYEIANLGKKIWEARKLSPKPLTQLAAEAGMSAANWYRIEKEEVKAVPEETVKAIERALGISLLGG